MSRVLASRHRGNKSLSVETKKGKRVKALTSISSTFNSFTTTTNKSIIKSLHNETDTVATTKVNQLYQSSIQVG